MQTKVKTPNNVGSCMHRGTETNNRLCKPGIMRVRGPNNVGRAVQTDLTLLPYAWGITEQKKCWELLAKKVWLASNFAQQLPTTRNNMQQGVKTDATCNTQKCWELVASKVASDGLNLIQKRLFFAPVWTPYYTTLPSWACLSRKDLRWSLVGDRTSRKIIFFFAIHQVGVDGRSKRWTKMGHKIIRIGVDGAETTTLNSSAA